MKFTVETMVCVSAWAKLTKVIWNIRLLQLLTTVCVLLIKNVDCKIDGERLKFLVKSLIQIQW